MKRAEAEAKLRQLQSVGCARARMLADDLLAASPGFDAPLREAIRHALLGVGIESPEIAARELSPGETWLLLYEPPRDGLAIRLRVSHGATTDERVAGEVRRAHRGLLHTAACACRQFVRPEPPSLDLEVPFGNFELEGSSLGLSVTIATLSHALGRAPSSAVAGSAQVDEDGRLMPIEHMTEKLAALRRSWPEVTRVVVAARQILPDPCPLVAVRCETLAEKIVSEKMAPQEELALVS
jgi:hypothetical protein